MIEFGDARRGDSDTKACVGVIACCEDIVDDLPVLTRWEFRDKGLAACGDSREIPWREPRDDPEPEDMATRRTVSVCNCPNPVPPPPFSAGQ